MYNLDSLKKKEKQNSIEPLHGHLPCNISASGKALLSDFWRHSPPHHWAEDNLWVATACWRVLGLGEDSKACDLLPAALPKTPLCCTCIKMLLSFSDLIQMNSNVIFLGNFPVPWIQNVLNKKKSTHKCVKIQFKTPPKVWPQSQFPKLKSPCSF